ncbi:MAG TPA: transketolase [Fimbriimonadaceae bacterium]|nr:transketolase [Fimbriimonadaceae bacterium]
MSATTVSLDELCINTIRGLTLDAVGAANSGHPGLPMGAGPMAYQLWTKHLKHNPKDPHWFDRDRFVLSAGHGSMLLYSLLHLTGYDVSLDDLKAFRQIHSRTPGHPENVLTPGVEVTTGPLGQGFAHAVGLAIAEAFLAATYNRPNYDIVDHFTYGICSDGDLMEGVSNEAASIAGHLRLGKLIFLYDDNGITIDGTTQIAFTEDVGARFEALGWHVQRIDGMDIEAVEVALQAAKAETRRPSLIKARTVIGYGSPSLQGTSKIHSNALKPEELQATKERLGIPLDPTFYIPEDALHHFRTALEQGARAQGQWNQTLNNYCEEFPKEAAELKAAIKGDLGSAWIDALPKCTEKIATRKASEGVIAAIAPFLPTLIGGSADLNESNLVEQKGRYSFQPDSYAGKNLHFGIREFGMAAAVNGITLHGATRGYGASFMVFTDYARPALRLAAIQDAPSIFVFTHDSIGVGEDGPTHEPIEHLTSLRAIPNFNLFRPADGNETAVAWKVALESKTTPTLLALTRQGVPPLTPDNIADHPAHKGAYILAEASGGKPAVTLVGTGSELQHCVSARDILQADGVPTRVVSFPSWFLFEEQPAAYRNQVIDRSIPTVSVEAGSTLAWPRYADAHVGIDRFGLSGNGDAVMKEFGFTADNVVTTARKLLEERKRRT